MTSNNKIIAALAVVLVVVGGVYLYSQSGPTQTSADNGRVVVGITDEAANMGAVSSVMITVDKAEIHSAASGWVTVSSAAREYDLLALKKSGTVSLYADAMVPVGTYEQARLIISNVVVVSNGESRTAKLPSGTLHIIGRTVVTADGTAAMVFDFMADKSMHMTGGGQFIFAPVVKFTSESSAAVQVSGGTVNTTNRGKAESNINVGMDERGETRANFEFKGDVMIDIDGMIKVGAGNRTVIVILGEETNSGISGRATLREEGGKVNVKLEMNSVLGVLTPVKPAHIHIGSCPGVGAVKYPLNSVVNGMSETKIDVTLAGLKAELPLAINVHKSAAESNVYVSCGEIDL